MWNRKKQSKDETRKKLNLLKRFASGEEVSTEMGLNIQSVLDSLGPAKLSELGRIKFDDRLSDVQKAERIKDLLKQPEKPMIWVCEMNGKPLYDIDGNPPPSWMQDDEPCNYEVDGRPVSAQEAEQKIAKAEAAGQFVWKETKTYQNEDIPEASELTEEKKRSESIERPLLNDLPVNGNNGHEKKQAKETPVIALTDQDYLKTKLEQIREQQAWDYEERQESLFWNEINKTL